MGVGGNGNIRFSNIFKNIPAFLGIALPVAYDSASFAAMHFRPTITKKTGKSSRLSLAKSKGMNFIDYSISLVRPKNRPGKTRPAQKPKEQYATGGNGYS